MPELIGAFLVAVHQSDAVLNQANPVSGTLYDVLTTTRNARLIGIGVSTNWTVQPTPLEVHVTIDGQSYTASFANPVTATLYMVLLQFDQTQPTLALAVSSVAQQRAFLLEGRSVRVQAEITGGTVQNLRSKVVYALY